MIVCSCNVFSDADVRDCLNRVDAPRSARDVYGCLGFVPKCGVCVETIRKIMESERQPTRPERTAAAALPLDVKFAETRAFFGSDGR